MLNIYIYKKIPNLPHIPLMDYFWGSSRFGVKRYGDDAIDRFNKQFFNVVENPSMADYFLIPHNFFYIRDSEYIQDCIQLSREHNKKILIFSYGDSDADIDVPNSIIFRTSQYAHKKKRNEIIMPAIADDLSLGLEFLPRTKSPKPVIGFCGWADFDNNTRKIKEYLKLIPVLIKSYIFRDNNAGAHRRGILFRRKIISILKSSSLVTANFLVRDSFSGNEKTRKLSFEQSRQEYIQNILDSDLSLAVKGDGNFSVRFYEILSLGRVPLFVNTDCILPLEEEIVYDDFVARVDSSDIANIAKRASEYYRSMTDSEFGERQEKARMAFETYLQADKFFSYVLTSEFLKKYE